MAKYSDIKGFTVQTLSSDTAASAIAGGSWASGGDLNTAARSYGAAGTQTAALVFGGQNKPPSYQESLTESYNGSSWSELNDLNTARTALNGAGEEFIQLHFMEGDQEHHWNRKMGWI